MDLSAASSGTKRQRSPVLVASAVPYQGLLEEPSDDDDQEAMNAQRILTENLIKLRRSKLNLLHTTLQPLVAIAAAAYAVSLSAELKVTKSLTTLKDLIQANRLVQSCKLAQKTPLVLDDSKSELQKEFILAQKTLLEKSQTEMTNLLLKFREKELENLQILNRSPSVNFLQAQVMKELIFFPNIDNDIKDEAIQRIATTFEEQLLTVHYHHQKKINAKPPAKEPSVAEDLQDKDIANATVSALIDKKLAPLQKQLNSFSKAKVVGTTSAAPKQPGTNQPSVPKQSGKTGKSLAPKSAKKNTSKNAPSVANPAQQKKQSGKKAPKASTSTSSKAPPAHAAKSTKKKKKQKNQGQRKKH